ncbi:PAS domain S-box/diguanylate cyclase (GGDEF) domain-containing protein [Terriglobus roseus DSM 18391]|uniref:PAS domain S-box/diguanylate cyclase (GGDEF) domain-containing protein n=1 Tax=Terriglobus roseus (strain DSM 18391 / NRRL B-41598 / KBS 63) TaxID=926566 RepID=I3ZIN8_TERRK|nr:EAL domain-containing protein [Terriglobus roseus]AFL89106.1 PAS domain S-box/diguanylate cyclase (GGDEF) domain-containing protein [Terriglobus roseus DSM 18391]
MRAVPNGLTREEAVALYEGAPCAYVSTDLDGKLLRVNNTFAKWLGHSKASLLSMRLQDVLTPASKILYETHYRPLLQLRGAVSDIALEFARSSGDTMPVIMTSVVKDAMLTQAAHVTTTFVDITERKHYERETLELKRKADSLADVVRFSDQAILTTSFDLSVETWNAAAIALFGDRLDYGTHLEALMPAENVKLLRAALAASAPVTFEITAPPDQLWEVKAYPVSEGLAVFFSDITKERTSQLELQRANERFSLATMATTEGIWDLDCCSGSVYYSGRFRSILGLPEEEFTGTMADWMELLHPADVERAQNAWHELQGNNTATLEIELRHRHEDGSWRWILCRSLCQRDETGKPTRLTGSISDITARKIVDPLTNLHNRLSLLEQLQWRIEREEHHDRCYALLFIDLDLFKRINDSLGHLKGDALLVEVGRRLEETVQMVPGSIVSRLGGDEFVVLLGDVTHEEDALTYASMLEYLLEVPIDCHGQEVFISASIGVAVGHPGSYTKAEQVLEDADVAMYAAKANGKAQSATFTQKMRARATTRLADEADLRTAVAEHQFELYYQPSVDLKSGAILGFEALTRWNHPTRGLVSPAFFIPLAEETGFVLQMGRWALETAIQQLAEWRRDGLVPPTATMAVNLSARQLNDCHLVGSICGLLKAAGLPSECLVLEVTESMLMDNAEGAVAALQAIAKEGIRLYMDDFGTGYSSLSYLHRYPFQCLKIDRSFIERMDDDPQSIKLVSAIMALGTTLGMSVIAEGIETEAQRGHLVHMGCEQAQGFLFSPAVQAHAIVRMVSQGPFPFPADRSALALPAVD